MKPFLARYLLAAMAGTALLTGCDTLQPLISPKPAPAHVPPATSHTTAKPALSADQLALRDGIELYNKGAYSDAIKRLSAPEIATSSKTTQLQALKYTAFSYCVSGRQPQCRASFEKAFKLDPAFDLQPGEHGHPLWGPAFAKAKKGK